MALIKVKNLIKKQLNTWFWNKRKTNGRLETETDYGHFNEYLKELKLEAKNTKKDLLKRKITAYNDPRDLINRLNF